MVTIAIRILSVAVLIEISSLAPPDFWTRRHLGNGKLYVYEGIGAEPSDVQRVRIAVTESPQSDESSTQKIHTIRLRWSPSKSADTYRVHCEANGTNEVVTIMDRDNLTTATGIDERFLLPSGELSVICSVKAANAYGSSRWTYSPMVTICSSGIETASTAPMKDDEENAQASSDDIKLDQLLKLIHASTIEKLPVKPIFRPPEERVIVRPPTVLQSSPSVSVEKPGFSPEQLAELEFMEGDIEKDYQELEEDIRRAIGATGSREPTDFRDRRQNELLDRVL